jgi:DNA-binding response OmpR family regulator
VSKQSLLLVDGDTRSLRVLEVSLRKAGFTVTPAVSVTDALDKLELDAPDLIISETTFPDGDGFELRRRVRATPDWGEIPFIFLTAENAIENKIRGLELGVDDYLTKPIYIKEIITRINILLQKRQRTRFEERRDGRTRFAGRVADMPVVDVIQTIEISRKSGVIQFTGDRGRQAAIYFRDGRVIDAEAGALQGEDAVYRLLTWNEGEFEVVFRTVRRREVIAISSQGLLMEGMRRLDEWSRLLEQLPSLQHRFEVDAAELAVRLGDVPDDHNRLLRLIDGKRTLLEVIDASDLGDLECLQAISKLYFEELLVDLDHGAPVARDTGKPMPLVELGSPTPAPAPSRDAVSGPHREPELDLDEAASPAEALAAAAAAMERASSAAAAAPDPEPEPAPGESMPGALMGGYRPSSLRLIDEAVAAAQAIEPLLFEDLGDDFEPHANGTAAGNGVAAAMARDLADSGERAADAAEDAARGEVAASEAARSATPPQGSHAVGAAALQAAAEAGPALPRTITDSGLRMIGSLGRDRAEASGELRMAGATPPPLSETQRELVTILPRRITREMQAVTLPETAVGRVPTPPTVVSEAAVAVARAATPPTVVSEAAAASTPETATGRAGTAPPVAAASTPETAMGRAGTAPPAADRVPTPPPVTGRAGTAPPVTDDAPPLPAPPPHGATQPPAASEAETASTATPPRSATPPPVPRSATPPPAPRSATPPPVAEASTTAPVEAPSERPSGRLPRTGSGVVRAQRRPGPAAMALIVLVGLLAGAAVYLRLRRPAPVVEPVAAGIDAGVTADAAALAPVPPVTPDAAALAPVPPVAPDADTAAAPAADAAAAAGDGAEPPAAGAGSSERPAEDRSSQARALLRRSDEALAEGAFQRALETADASIALRKTARAYLARARALQRLDRVDEALAAIDAAQKIAPRYASVFELRGRILWAVRRREEARQQFELFLELEPEGQRAQQLKKLLAEPR